MLNFHTKVLIFCKKIIMLYYYVVICELKSEDYEQFCVTLYQIGFF